MVIIHTIKGIIKSFVKRSVIKMVRQNGHPDCYLGIPMLKMRIEIMVNLPLL